MPLSLSRRAVLGAAIAAGVALPALGQDATNLRFSAVFSEQDIRAQMMQMFAEGVGPEFVVEPYFGGNAVQAGHRTGRTSARQPGDGQHRAPGHRQPDAGMVSILTAAYLFRDADHLRDVLRQRCRARR